MRFKPRNIIRWALISIVSVVSMGLGGCQYLFGPGALPRKEVKLKETQETAACLAEAPNMLVQYFQRREGAKPAEAVIDCAVRSIDLFVRYTRGSDASEYTIEEIRGFLETYFVKDKNISPGFIREMMKLKQAWFGGSDDRLSRDELARIRSLVLALKPAADRLYPYADLFGFETYARDEGPAGVERLERGIEEMIEVIGDLALHFNATDRKAYSFTDFEALIREATVGASGSDLLKYMPLLPSLKGILMGPPGNVISPTEWRDLLRTGARLYTFWLRYEHLLKERSLLATEQMPQVTEVARQSLSLLEDAIGRRPDRRIPLAEWQDVVKRLEQTGVLPHPLRATSILHFLPGFFNRILREPGQPEVAASGLGSSELKTLRLVFEDWRYGHERVLMALQGQETLALATAVERLRGPGQSDKRAKDLGLKTDRELADLLAQGRPLTWDANTQLRVRPRSETLEVSERDLMYLNAIRMVMRAVMRGYASDPQRAVRIEGLTVDEAQAFYMDMREIGLDLGYMDPRVRNAGSRSFLEANLFTSVSNGDNRMSLHEGVEFFAYVLSSGNASRRLHERAVQKCGTGQMDLFGKETLKSDCFRNILRENLADIFGNLERLPEYVQSVQARDGREWEFFDVLGQAARPVGERGVPVDQTEMRAMSSILHYTESLFVDFDTVSIDGVLDEEEVWAAFPRFQDFIRRLANGMAEEEWKQKTLYSYILAHGGPPEDGASGKVGFLWWQVRRQFYTERAERLDFMKIIRSIGLHSYRVRVQGFASLLKKYGPTFEKEVKKGSSPMVRELAELLLCEEKAVPDLARVLRANLSATLRPAEGRAELGGEAFAMNISRLVKNDPVLNSSCQALH